MKPTEWAIWEFEADSDSKGELIDVDYFAARGMLRVYGRGDHYGPRCTLNMDIWQTKDGRLLARFWSRSSHVTTKSIELVGFSQPLPLSINKTELDDRWAPRLLREEYDDWIDEEMMDMPGCR